MFDLRRRRSRARCMSRAARLKHDCPSNGHRRDSRKDTWFIVAANERGRQQWEPGRETPSPARKQCRADAGGGWRRRRSSQRRNRRETKSKGRRLVLESVFIWRQQLPVWSQWPLLQRVGGPQRLVVTLVDRACWILSRSGRTPFPLVSGRARSAP